MIDRTHLVITGPSGSGKSTIVNHILSRFPTFSFSVSYTTRPPREGEVDGKDYFFLTKDMFEKMIAENEFLEHTFYNENYYGTSVAQFQEANKTFLLDVDIDGASYCRKLKEKFVVVYIHCERDTAYERLIKRAGGKTEEAENRMRLFEKFDAIKHECDHILDNSYMVEETKKNIEEFVKTRFSVM